MTSLIGQNLCMSFLYLKYEPLLSVIRSVDLSVLKGREILFACFYRNTCLDMSSIIIEKRRYFPYYPLKKRYMSAKKCLLSHMGIDMNGGIIIIIIIIIIGIFLSRCLSP